MLSKFNAVQNSFSPAGIVSGVGMDSTFCSAAAASEAALSHLVLFAPAVLASVAPNAFSFRMFWSLLLDAALD